MKFQNVKSFKINTFLVYKVKFQSPLLFAVAKLLTYSVVL